MLVQDSLTTASGRMNTTKVGVTRWGRSLHGVLAPHAKLRAAIVASPVHQATEHAADHAHAHGSAISRMSWARLLKRVFDIDLEYCPRCAGRLKIIAAIEDPTVIAKMLTHLHLPARAPPQSPARRLDLFQAA
jgi:hypothetical protein